MIRAADHVLDVGPGPGVHGGRIIAQGTVPEIIAEPKSLTGQYLSGVKRIETPGRPAHGRRPIDSEERDHDQGRNARTTSSTIDVSFPLGGPQLRSAGARLHDVRRTRTSRAHPDLRSRRRLHLRHRRLRFRQIHARQRHPPPGRQERPARRPCPPRRAHQDHRPEPHRPRHRGRPIPHRAHASLQPRHLHGHLRRDPARLLHHQGSQDPRLQARTLQLQRPGQERRRALRGL